MFELNSLFLGSGKPPETSETVSNEGFQDHAKNKDNPFGAILDENLKGSTTAKSGNGIKESGNEAPIRESDSKLQTRTLKGGIELALGGVEPSQDVIADYAKSQGLDADLIEILMTAGVSGAVLEKELLLDPSTLGQLSAPATLTESRESLQAKKSAVPIAPETLLTQNGHSITNSDLPTIKPGLQALETIQGFRDQVVSPTQTLQSSASALRPKEALTPNSASSRATTASAPAATDAVIPQNGRSIAASDLPTIKPGLQALETIQGFRDQVVSPTQTLQSSASALRPKEALTPNSASSRATTVSAPAATDAVIPQNGRSIAASDLPTIKPGLQALETIQGFRDQVVSPTQTLQSSASALRSKEVLTPNSASSRATTVSAPAATDAVIPQNGRSIAASDLPTIKPGLQALETIQGFRDQVVSPTQTLQSSASALRPKEALTPNSASSRATTASAPAATDAVIPQNGRSIAASDLPTIKPGLQALETIQGFRDQVVSPTQTLQSSASALRPKEALTPNSASSRATTASAPAATDAVIPQNGRSIAASDLPTIKPGLQALETIQGFRDQVVSPTQTLQSSASALRSKEVLTPNSASSRATTVSAPAATDAVIPQNERSIAASDLPIANAGLNYAKASSKAPVIMPDTVSDSGAKTAKTEAALIQNDRKSPVSDLLFAKLESTRLPATQPHLGNMTRIMEATLPKGHHSVANNDINIAKPERARAINPSVIPNARPQEAQKTIRQAQSKVDAPEQVTLIIPTKISKEVKSLEPRGVAIEKLAPIKLPASAEIIISHNQQQRPDLVKRAEASKKDLGSDIITQPTSSSRVNSSDKPGLDQIENLGKQETLRRQDQYLDLSRRLTDALGQRLTAQISRGSWHVEMELHPRTLGRIEIQLEMKNGELEAHFNASRAATRDLIQEGLPRLRAELEQHGTESAYVGVGQQNNGKSDGKPTGADHSGNEVESDDQGSEPQELTKLKAAHKQGLDIQV